MLTSKTERKLNTKTRDLADELARPFIARSNQQAIAYQPTRKGKAGSDGQPIRPEQRDLHWLHALPEPANQRRHFRTPNIDDWPFKSRMLQRRFQSYKFTVNAGGFYKLEVQ